MPGGTFGSLGLLCDSIAALRLAIRSFPVPHLDFSFSFLLLEHLANVGDSGAFPEKFNTYTYRERAAFALLFGGWRSSASVPVSDPAASALIPSASSVNF